MPKTIVFDEEARKKLLQGAEILYKAVSTTMGPKGRNAVIQRPYGPADVTHDGVTVAKNIDLPLDDPAVREGAEMIKQAAQKMNTLVGDGTTTVTVLTYHILKEANKLIAQGLSPMVLAKEIQAYAEKVVKKLEKQSQDVGDHLEAVATISAGSKELGECISGVFSKIGVEGTVVVETGSASIDAEIIEGYKFEQGVMYPAFMNDAARKVAVYQNPMVLVTDAKISFIKDLNPIIKDLVEVKKCRELVIVCEDLEGQALNSVLQVGAQQHFFVLPIKAPGYGEQKVEALKDLAAVFGTHVYSVKEGKALEDIKLTDLGTCEKIVSTIAETSILPSSDPGRADVLKARKETVRGQIENDPDDDLTKKRLNALDGKVAIIKVGGQTDQEIEEKKYRVDDAVAASKAALEGGILPGAGSTLFVIGQERPNTVGGRILQEAIKAPAKKILINSGFEDTYQILLDKMLKQEPGFGYDVSKADPELIHLIESGIADPTKVTIEAVKTAVAVATMSITMGVLIVEEAPKEE